MSEWVEGVMSAIFAFGMLFIFILAFSETIDNQAARLDPSSPYYASQSPR